MKEKFTKGEWFVSTKPESEHYLITVDCGGSMSIPIITSALDLSYYDTEERESNAHLIAAAPEMYKFLDDLANGRGTDYPIEKLLAKARGESNE